MLCSRIKFLRLFAFVLFATGSLAWADNPFVGRWALTIPGSAAGWLGIEEKDGALQGSILWGGGSVVPVQGVKVDGDKLTVTRLTKAKNKTTNTEDTITETITASFLKEEV